MEQYISKFAIVTEIRKRLLPTIRDKHYDEWEEGQNSERIAILEIIDALEVKEVNLDGEINLWVRNLHRVPNFEELNKFARHFFELGLKAQKGETNGNG